MNVTDPASASAVLKAFPFGQPLRMHFELMPLAPLNPLRQLLGAPSRSP